MPITLPTMLASSSSIREMPGELAEHFLEVDVCVLAELEDDEASLELVQMYEQETKSIIQQLDAAYPQIMDVSRAAQAWPLIWAYMRKLKGSSLSIGLTGVAAFIDTFRQSDTSTLREWCPQASAQLQFAVEQSVKQITGHLIS